MARFWLISGLLGSALWTLLHQSKAAIIAKAAQSAPGQESLASGHCPDARDSVAVVGFAARSAQAANYFVSPEGRDGNSGTGRSPWSLARANAAGQPGSRSRWTMPPRPLTSGHASRASSRRAPESRLMAMGCRIRRELYGLGGHHERL
jgi:hypothetical protein